MSTALPKAIQAQLDEAEKIEQALAAKAVEAAKGAEVPPEPPAPEAETVPTPAPEAAAPEPEKAVAEPVVTASAEDEESFKRKFDTLKGKYDTEVPRLYDEVRTRDQRLEALQREVEQLKKPAVPEQKADPLVSAKDEETFGTELVDLTRRVAREEFGHLANVLMARVVKEIAPLRAQMGNVVEKQVVTDKERFYEVLNEQVSDWEQVNADPRWLTWLAEVDPLTGTERQVALNEAHSALDSVRVVGIFNLWKAQFQKKSPPAPTDELQRQVAPARTGGSAPAPAAKKIWTKAEYESAFDPRRARTMSAAEVTQLQAEADLAAQENRIRW